MAETIILDQYSKSIQYLCKKDKRLAKVISMVGPIAYQTHDEPFAFLIHEIIVQMLSIKASTKIYSQLEELYDGLITPENISQLSDEQIKSIGTSASKASYIRGVTEIALSDKICFEEFPEMTDLEICKKLLSLKGVGYETAKMYLIKQARCPPYRRCSFPASI